YHYPRKTPSAVMPRRGGSRNYAPRLMSRPSTTTATIHTSAVTTVSRSRLRSTTDDPPREEVTPPPNRSDRPPPLPLCSSTSIRRRTLQTITRMDRPRITRSPVTRPRRGGMDDLGPQDRVLAARLGLGPGGGGDRGTLLDFTAHRGGTRILRRKPPGKSNPPRPPLGSRGPRESGRSGSQRPGSAGYSPSRTSLAKSSPLRLAPPTSAPSTSCSAMMPAMLSGLTEPP